MIAKTYGIYDSVQEEYVQTFTAKNDDDAKRSAAVIVRSQGFNEQTYKDRSIHHIYDFDTVTGQVVDNSVRQVLIFATVIEQAKQEALDKQVREKILTDEFKQELKDFILKSLRGEIHDEQSAN